jgi:hypothetical protein
VQLERSNLAGVAWQVLWLADPVQGTRNLQKGANGYFDCHYGYGHQVL